jgi:hypothetical protein
MAIKRFGPAYSSKSGSGAYFGYGAGLTYSRRALKMSMYDEWDYEGYEYTWSESEIDPSLMIAAGAKFGRSVFAEINYFWGGDKLNTGTILSIGAKF